MLLTPTCPGPPGSSGRELSLISPRGNEDKEQRTRPHISLQRSQREREKQAMRAGTRSRRNRGSRHRDRRKACLDPETGITRSDREHIVRPGPHPGKHAWAHADTRTPTSAAEPPGTAKRWRGPKVPSLDCRRRTTRSRSHRGRGHRRGTRQQPRPASHTQSPAPDEPGSTQHASRNRAVRTGEREESCRRGRTVALRGEERARQGSSRSALSCPSAGRGGGSPTRTPQVCALWCTRGNGR